MKNLDPEKSGLKILDYEKRLKKLNAAKKIRRPHGIIY